MIPNTPQGEIDPVSAMLLEYCYNGLNEPVALPVVVRTIAKQLAKDPREVADALTKTALELFKFPHNDSICWKTIFDEWLSGDIEISSLKCRL